MEYFDVRNVPEGFLRIRFKACTMQETENIAQLFKSVVIAINAAKPKNQKLRIGFSGAGASGKSTFIKKILSLVFNVDDRIASFNSDYSNMYRNQEAGTWWHYDNYGHNHRDSDYSRANSGAAVHLVEWPDHHNERNPLFQCLWAFYYEGSKDTASSIKEREIDFYCTDEVWATPEMQQFIEDTSEFRVDIP